MKDYFVNSLGERIMIDKAAVLRCARKAYKEKDKLLKMFAGNDLWIKSIIVAFYKLYKCTNIYMFAELLEMELTIDHIAGFHRWDPIDEQLEKAFPKDFNNLLSNE